MGATCFSRKESSDGEILGANCCRSLLWLLVAGVSVLCWSVSVMSCCELLLCDCIWLCVYVGGVVDVV